MATGTKVAAQVRLSSSANESCALASPLGPPQPGDQLAKRQLGAGAAVSVTVAPRASW